MKVTTKVVPCLKLNLSNAFLAAIHAMVLIASILVHPVYDTTAARALS